MLAAKNLNFDQSNYITADRLKRQKNNVFVDPRKPIHESIISFFLVILKNKLDTTKYIDVFNKLPLATISNHEN
jgi:hypothetical protein